MLKKTFWFLLALGGLAFSLFMIYQGKRQPPSPSLYFPPPESPYRHSIAAEGIVESFEQNTAIGTPFPELITNVYVETGAYVEKDTPLFKLDTRQLESSLATEQAKVVAAQIEVERQTCIFSYFEHLNNKGAVSKQDYSQAYYTKAQAEAALVTAIASAEQVKTNIIRSTIYAPSAGMVLQQNAHVGEVANLNPFTNIPLMIFGKINTVQLRANIAEEDAWRVCSGAPATAYIKGNSSLSIPLKFSYIEPFVIPKEQLTGADAERVDTRVLQVIYTFEKCNHPIYVGQLLDMYIEAKPSRQQ